MDKAHVGEGALLALALFVWGQVVAFVGVLALKLAGGGKAQALFGCGVGFDFRHAGRAWRGFCGAAGVRPYGALPYVGVVRACRRGLVPAESALTAALQGLCALSGDRETAHKLSHVHRWRGISVRGAA